MMGTRSMMWRVVCSGIGGTLLWFGCAGAQPFRGGLPVCVAALRTCEADLGSCQVALETCQSDFGLVEAKLETCQSELGGLEMALEACRAQAQLFPATGQMSCWDSSGFSIPCEDTGHDGDIQAGAPLSYTDNDDGTITDNNTRLMWEKLCDEDPAGLTCPEEHDVDTTYSWEEAVTKKIAILNTAPCFATYCDWRLPNVKELTSIVNYQNVDPAVSQAFDNNCVASCAVTTCNCNAIDVYWSSTSVADSPVVAWVVGFSIGNASVSGKSFKRRVRAVRGGW